MTVGIGLVCKDGVLVASDSMGSNAQIAMQSIKVHAFANNPVIWTGSGSVFVLEEVDAVLRAKVDTSELDGRPRQVFADVQRDEIRKQLDQFVKQTMGRAYKSALGQLPVVPAGQIFVAFPADFMLLGWSKGEAWFLEIAADGQINWHTSSQFYAVGSGGQFATVCMGLLRHYADADLTLEGGKLIAYRSIETTCEVSSGGVGLPVQMAIVDDNGQRLLTTDEIEEIKLGVERWRTLERETLGITAESAGATAVRDLPAAAGEEPHES